MIEDYKVFWGDLHCNLHLNHLENLNEIFEDAKRNLDFLPIAYYPMDFYQTKEGIWLESWHNRPEFLKGWESIKQVARDFYLPGTFVTFVGYEWHGNRTYYGDHNVFYFDEENPLDDSEDLPTLFDNLKKRRGIAIPHHTAYQVHQRGKDWDYHDDEISPFVEIFSNHGSSEGCWTPSTLNLNGSMGPRVSGGSVQDGLARGYRLGIIASSDNHEGKAGAWGQGLAAVFAKELTREEIWNSFMSRRVYGVTGDRIILFFYINEHFMGDFFEASSPLKIHGKVIACAPLDRVEIIRNNRVIYTYCHNGNWDIPISDFKYRIKLRLIFGFGPTEWLYHYNSGPYKSWHGDFSIQGGRILSVEGCFSLRNQLLEFKGENYIKYDLTTERRFKEAIDKNIQQIIVEVEGSLDSKLILRCENKILEFTLREALQKTHILAMVEEVQRDIEAKFGVKPNEVENPDIYWHNAYKIKVERAVPEVGYNVPFEFIDDNPPKGKNFYYIRVSQLNGQMAWSSPIWVNVT